MAVLGKLSGTNNTVGIDIGSHSIKVAQISSGRNGYVLHKAGSTLTPVDAIKNGVVDDVFSVSDAVRRLLNDLEISGSMAVGAVSGPSVVVRQVQLPAMPENQLRKSISWEARNYISFPVEDSQLAFEILGTNIVDGVAQMDVMLVAAPRELVDSRVATLEQAGVEPIAVELEPFALIRSVIDFPLSSPDFNETMAIIEIGASYTHITIIANGAFGLTRSVTIAGNNFTDTIASVLSLETAEAERVKEEEMAVVSEESARALLSPQGQEASRAIEPILEELTREIRRSFAFYDYQQSPSSIDQRSGGIGRVVLCGGTSKMRGMREYLEDQLGIPVEMVDILRPGLLQLPAGVDGMEAQMPMMASAFGLALREPMLSNEKGGSR